MKFFAPWCPHCQKLAPTWEQLADHHPEFHVGSVDCTAEASMALCEKYNVTVYPTVLYFPPAQEHADELYYTYFGDRSIWSFVEFTKDQHYAITYEAPPKGKSIWEKIKKWF